LILKLWSKKIPSLKKMKFDYQLAVQFFIEWARCRARCTYVPRTRFTLGKIVADGGKMAQKNIVFWRGASFFLTGDKIKNRSDVNEQKMDNKAQMCRARALLSHDPRKFCQQKSHMLRKPI